MVSSLRLQGRPVHLGLHTDATPLPSLSAASTPGQKEGADSKQVAFTDTVTRYNQAFHPSRNPTGKRYPHRR